VTTVGEKPESASADTGETFDGAAVVVEATSVFVAAVDTTGFDCTSAADTGETEVGGGATVTPVVAVSVTVEDITELG